MSLTSKRFHVVFSWVVLAVCALMIVPSATAQRTLGGVTGTVTDKTGSVLPETTVTIVSDETKLTRSQKTNAEGNYDFVNLPIGNYTLTYTHDGFQTQKVPSITVQADRTATVNAVLAVGQVGTVVEVDASPLVNAVDTTNGYILEKEQIDAVPLPTGSFTGLAILSPGVDAELPGGTGVNSGLGNQPIWANGQRDTSNSFLVNGVDASNLFNGKSTSQVASARIVNNTGVANAASTSGAPIQSTASVYLAIGQAIPTPAPETIQEVRVNTSMYDAQQGSTSGAHIDMSTASGTNSIHGTGYIHRGTDWLNAAPFFNKQDANLPDNDKVPQLHRYTAGGALGGALIKDKVFGYAAFQHVHDSDQEIGLSRMLVPKGLSSDRSVPALEAISDTYWGTQLLEGQGSVSPVAVQLLQAKLPNGQYLIPNDDGVIPTPIFPENAISPGTAFFTSNQAVANLDWNRNAKNTISAKYYYQHDPTVAPYAYSNVAGFPQNLDAGSQVASLTNTQSIRPTFSVTEVIGILREKVFSTIGQPFSPQQFNINTFGSSFFPGITIVDPLGLSSAANTGGIVNLQFLTIGEGSASQGPNTGVFQNRIMPSANAIWMRGRHTFTFGGSYAYTQLNTRDERTNQGIISTADYSQFLQGFVNTNDDFTTTKFLQGDANRYYRAGQVGTFLQDKFQFRSNLSVTAGLRFDWNGGLTEKDGRIFNFDPSRYCYSGDQSCNGAPPDTIASNGFIIAGNNKLFPTKGVSNTTLTGRQWGFAPRIGLAWSPKRFNDKVVVRTGTGIYYDRGELFTYLSPGFAEGVINGGPFGVNQTPPYVNAQACTPSTFYQGFIPTCAAPAFSLNNPWGPTPGPLPSGNPADITQSLPNEAAIAGGAQLFSFATYNRANKLPYTINNTLDIQWQPRNDLAIEVGYVGNLGRHGVIPVPFNQPGIASPSHVIHPNAPYPQSFTYGYTVQGPSTCNPLVFGSCNPINLQTGVPCATTSNSCFLSTFEGGNVDLRVPFIGYSAESETYKAAGVSEYNALQTHIEKRLSHGIQVGFSYTYSHALDEQSGMGLFFNGNNPLDLRSAYGSSDFDRTHVFNLSFRYQTPKLAREASLLGKIANGWALQGLGVFQSGQPYSIIDYTGAVGSIYYSVFDGITNPIVPLAPGCTPKNALTGASGAYANSDPSNLNLYALKQSCFTLPLLSPGGLGGAIPANDTFETNFTTGERNIFRQAWQRRLDMSLAKNLLITERLSLKYTLDVFNVTNTTSFDIPIDDVSQNQFYNNFPVEGVPLYNPPSGLGAVNKIIGSPRQIQMTLRMIF
jgi:carboxypeptidase family protein